MKRKKTTVGLKLLRYVFSAYFIVTFSVTASQMWFEYSGTKSRIYQEITQLHKTHNDGLAKSLWEFNQGQTESIVNGLSNVGILKGVRITGSDYATVAETGDRPNELVKGDKSIGETLQPLKLPGRDALNQLYQVEFPVVYKDLDGTIHEVGFGYLYTSEAVFIESVKGGFILLIVNSIIKTLALWLIFLFMTSRIVTRPIDNLIKTIKGIDPHRPEGKELPTRMQSRRDEIGVLARSFQEMVHSISSNVNTINSLNNELEEHNNQLEATVTKRTEQLVKKQRDMTSLFESIPLGVITIGENGVIGKIRWRPLRFCLRTRFPAVFLSKHC